ncbi:uncharacterized protein [Coffea arabica]|nr:uncharacterized protein LOC113706759 isoform X1 [Coffea arabica]XP_027084534.1 uncharacterized protein LOC113706759 isoform X1 [Coffea arabica]XP_027084535.1 uncharacterized protein LOC113706759 isoform X1 [Coffea arabica]XP_027084536.1 uncharacterized protein LOC113706759 isoform X1 [Coffea arabica]XP_027084537.1 uncharacterized protein LOC113706759 isoform X1 [Coffea arabica]XP_027084538.1 uncharacterized protein LOC113706759 isoform X1 [Coffea arabica]XP_027084539.1 uncharacterized prot
MDLNMNGNDNSNPTAAAAAATDGSGNIGLVISTTETIRSFLMTASTDPNLPQDLRDLASSLSPHSSLSYKSLKSIWIGSDPKTRPSLFRLFSGSNFIFTSPKPREKSEELKARLRKLAEVAEKKEYEELVKDITPKKGVEEPFSSYKDQLGLGLHVAVTMFTGYLVGYAAFRALFSRNVGMSAAGGILGLVGGMLVETLLFIIRSTNQDRRPSAFVSRIKKDQ